MATGGNVNNYPSFEVAKTIRVDDMNITPGYYTYMGRENGGKGVYLNVHTKQTLGFDLDMLKSLNEKHPTDIQILMKKGGRVKKGNYSYIPQEEIDYLVTEYGKKIDGNKLLDGAYAKGNTKAPKITRTQFEEEDYEFAKGGKLSYRESGENYEYINSFGIEQDDFKKIVDAYHKSPSSNQLDRIESRMTFSKMRDKYGKDKVDEVGNYIHETHELHSNMAKGGGIKKGNYSYIPQEEIDYLVTEYGKKIDGNKLLDGAYAKGNTKAPKMVRSQFEEEDYEFANGGSMGSRVNYQNDDFALVMLGGSIGSKTSLPIFVNGKMGSIVESGNNKEMLKEKAARMRKQLSAGERKHYGMSYTVVALTPAKIKEIERFKNK